VGVAAAAGSIAGKDTSTGIAVGGGGGGGAAMGAVSVAVMAPPAVFAFSLPCDFGGVSGAAAVTARGALEATGLSSWPGGASCGVARGAHRSGTAVEETALAVACESSTNEVAPPAEIAVSADAGGTSESGVRAGSADDEVCERQAASSLAAWPLSPLALSGMPQSDASSGTKSSKPPRPVPPALLSPVARGGERPPRPPSASSRAVLPPAASSSLSSSSGEGSACIARGEVGVAGLVQPPRGDMAAMGRLACRRASATAATTSLVSAKPPRCRRPHDMRPGASSNGEDTG